MLSWKIFGAAAILTLAVPVIDATPSHAQEHGMRGGGHGGGPRMGGGGGGGPRVGMAGGPRFGGGNFGRGGGWNRGGGGFVPGAVAGALIGGAIASQRGYPGYYGNSGYGGGYYGSSYGAYYGAPYDDGGEVVEVAPAGGGDVDYCIQTYKSYNLRTGTYLGYDGNRYACP